MFGTYKNEDVTILLKNITGLVEPQSTEERERQIQRGRHYCEMLPIEYEPSQAYLDTFENALSLYGGMTGRAVASVAQQIWKDKGEDVVLVSLARAGTPVGILIKRYIRAKYHAEVKHYTISIIRGKGIDKNAMNFILAHHEKSSVQFVDGWTGKGAIQRQLDKAMEEYPGVSSGLAVLSDPAYVAQKCGTHDDFLIASSCLNSTVSGLLSRTFLREGIIEESDYHGAVFYENLVDCDLTYHFIDSVVEKFDFNDLTAAAEEKPAGTAAADEVREIAGKYNIADIHLIKPSIGEATRVLLRRMPWMILVHSMDDHEHLGHLYQLADEKGVKVVEYPLRCYRACGIIKLMADA